MAPRKNVERGTNVWQRVLSCLDSVTDRRLREASGRTFTGKVERVIAKVMHQIMAFKVKVKFALKCIKGVMHVMCNFYNLKTFD